MADDSKSPPLPPFPPPPPRPPPRAWSSLNQFTVWGCTQGHVFSDEADCESIATL